MSLYKQQGSRFWWVNISIPGQPRLRESTGTEDRAEAQRYHDERKAKLWREAPKLNGRTWGMAVDAWCAVEERSESELLSLAKFGRMYADRPLAKIDAESIEKVLDSFCKTAGTFMRYRTMILAILNLAKGAGWITELPRIKVRRDKKQKVREWLTREQFDRLYAELPKHMKPMALFAVETGLRQANVLGLTWDRVDLKRKLVWIEAEDTKADEPITVPLSIGAFNLLKELHDAEGRDDTWVFTFRGKPIKEVKTAFIAACVRAGVGTVERTGYTGFTWHGFRHTWATWHVQNGTPLDVLQRLGGWADLRMVMKYAHHAPSFVASFADNVRK